MRPATPVVVHANRTVLVSHGRSARLRVHRGLVYAPDRVLRAVVMFTNPLSSASARRDAKRVIESFDVGRFMPDRLPPPPSGKYRTLATRLSRLHRVLNRRFFDGTLDGVSIRVSARMRTRLGEIAVDRRRSRPSSITIGLAHIRRDGWEEVEKTLLHEMVHQWQVESGGLPDHGRSFRDKARAVGIAPHAARDIRPIQPDLLED